ncbi:MAG: M1 family aminopeptidase [Candidatus Eisenbacteria bacterium]
MKDRVQARTLMAWLSRAASQVARNRRHAIGPRTGRMLAVIGILLAANPLALAADISAAGTSTDASADASRQPYLHGLTISLFPPDRSLRALDSIYFTPEHLADGKIKFLINSALSVENVTSSNPIARWYTQEDVDPGLFKVAPDSEDIELVKRSRGIFIEFSTLPATPGAFPIVIAYSGVIYDSLQAPSKSYAKGFETTTGLVGEEGAFLTNESLWYPFQFDQMFSFRLKVDVPAGWMAVSQGGLTREYAAKIADKDRLVAVWAEPNPTPELYLVAGKYVRHDDAHNSTKIMTYTYEPSDSLCQVYINATKRYLAMYDRLIGDYPYPKFALVENFWQTGFGMPSFTLLGDKVIRLPFIVNTSYGHEILHNWWGNSVYVDSDEGNWCEGLTTYGADYLYKEQMSAEQARDYRHHTLIAFSNYVTERKDFPISEFTERSDAATQSVGYGKSLMLYHMLRKSIGDSLFWDSLRAFYARYKFRMASWSDLAKVFSETSGQDLSWFFDQWVKRSGAPSVRLVNSERTRSGGSHTLTFTLEQDSPPFIIDLPLKVETTHGTEDFVVRLRGQDSTYSIALKSQPIAFAIDPDFDTFRRLYIEEIPITLGSVFAQDSILVVIGGAEDEITKNTMRDVAKSWDIAGTMLDESEELEGRASTGHVWLMGRGPLSKKLLAPLRPAIEIGDDSVRIDDSTYTLTGNTFVCALRNTRDETLGIGIVLSQDVQSLRALASRLPHYSSYSYLIFEKGTPILKGVWKERRSPLRVDFIDR